MSSRRTDAKAGRRTTTNTKVVLEDKRWKGRKLMCKREENIFSTV